MTQHVSVLGYSLPNYKEMINGFPDDYSKQPTQGKQEEPTMKVSYKGVTGELLKLELSRKEDVNTFPGVKKVREYTLEIIDETDGHKHVFKNVDVSEIKFVGATVNLA